MRKDQTTGHTPLQMAVTEVKIHTDVENTDGNVSRQVASNGGNYGHAD